MGPTFNIEGHYTAQKLSKLGFGEYVSQEKFYVKGITKITPEDIKFAKNELNYVIKLLRIFKQTNSGLKIKVHPIFLPKDHLLVSIGDVFNAIYLIDDFVGPIILYGQLSGRMATASVVIGDSFDIIFTEDKKINYSLVESQIEPIKDIGNVVLKYYINVNAFDKTGVLQIITGILNKSSINIESITQKNSENEAVPIIIVTHETTENKIQKAIKTIDDLEEVKKESNLIRILDN